MTTADLYWERCDEYLDKAFTELNAGDLLQASEKGWGAAAQAVKAIAEDREETHRHHAAILQMAYKLARETSDPQIRTWFNGAQALHQNFYEGAMAADDVAAELESVARLVARLREISEGSTG